MKHVDSGGSSGDLLNASQEPRRGDLERAGDADNVDEAHVSLAALDPAYICPVKVSFFSQRLLRKPFRQPTLPDGLAELNSWIRGHAPDIQ